MYVCMYIQMYMCHVVAVLIPSFEYTESFPHACIRAFFFFSFSFFFFPSFSLSYFSRTPDHSHQLHIIENCRQFASTPSQPLQPPPPLPLPHPRTLVWRLLCSHARRMHSHKHQRTVTCARTQTHKHTTTRCEAGCTRFNTTIPSCKTLAGEHTQECCISTEKCLHRPNSQDAWATYDIGRTWLLAGNAPWQARTFAHAITQEDGALLLVGGYDSWDRYFAEMWRSFDGGASWVRLHGNETVYLSWAARSQGNLALLGSCPVLFGGHSRTGESDYRHYHDAWTPAPISNVYN